MRGHSTDFPYMCMLCGIETKDYDGMIEHFRVEHPIEWSYVKRPNEFDEVFSK